MPTTPFTIWQTIQEAKANVAKADKHADNAAST
jgi:hypothetical protein